MTKFMCLLSLAAVYVGTHASEVSVSHPSTDSNVRYKQVTELGFKPATEKLVYGDDDPGLQYGMLWLPEDVEPGEKSPLVVLNHGGCWLNEFDIEHTYPLSTALVQAGYAVWSLEYRRTGDTGGGWPGTFELHPNTVLLHGDIDAIVPVHQSTLLETKSDVLTGAGHFDWVHPGTPAFQRFLSILNGVLDQ